MYILKVPHSNNALTWYSFLKRERKLIGKVKKLVVDFGKVYFLDTDDFAVLACLIESFYQNDCEITITGGSRKFKTHLDNIRFKEYWQPGFNRCNFTHSKNNTTLCLWKIDPTMSHQYSIYAQKYFQKFNKEKDLVGLSSNMNEVFNNIFDHSKSPEFVNGYIITQFYPKNNILEFSVCDFGIGIPTSLKLSDKIDTTNKSDCYLINKALELGFTTGSTPQNKGMGLHFISDLIEDSNGELTITSNNGALQKAAGEPLRIQDFGIDFEGTLIKVRVDLNTFEELEDKDFEDIFEL